MFYLLKEISQYAAGAYEMQFVCMRKSFPFICLIID